MVEGGQPLRMLDRICERYPVVMHGVSLSIASTSPLDFDYLTRLKALAARLNPKWISDHLCWTGVHGVNLHDLLPIPYTREALDHVVDRVSQVQRNFSKPTPASPSTPSLPRSRAWRRRWPMPSMGPTPNR